MLSSGPLAPCRGKTAEPLAPSGHGTSPRPGDLLLSRGGQSGCLSGRVCLVGLQTTLGLSMPTVEGHLWSCSPSAFRRVVGYPHQDLPQPTTRGRPTLLRTTYVSNCQKMYKQAVRTLHCFLAFKQGWKRLPPLSSHRRPLAGPSRRQRLRRGGGPEPIAPPFSLKHNE